MKNNQVTALQVLKLVEIFVTAILSKSRSGLSAKRLISRKEKIEYLVRDFSGFSQSYNFFETKILSPRWSADDDSCLNLQKIKHMTTRQALEISKIFGEILASNIDLVEDLEKLIKNKAKLISLVDELFEMSPAFNLFEYRRYIKQATLSSFKEVSSWDHNVFIVCTDDEVCLPYGFKSGDRVFSPHCSYDTIIGVAPFENDGKMAIWIASDSDQFRDQTRPVVGAWKNHDLKKAGFILIAH